MLSPGTPAASGRLRRLREPCVQPFPDLFRRVRAALPLGTDDHRSGGRDTDEARQP